MSFAHPEPLASGSQQQSDSPSLLGRLLVVDDEKELLEALCERLSKQGYAVKGYTSAKKALEELKEREFDLLLTDLMMPEMDGLALLQAAQQINPDLVGIMMTGQGTIQTAIDALKLGALDYVLKPFKLQSILPVLARALDVRRLRLENIQLRETVAIQDLCQAISFIRDSNTLVNKIADAALDQCEADEVSVMLPCSDGDELQIASVRGKNRDALLGERVPVTCGVAGWVARHWQPLVLQGEISDPRFLPYRPRGDIHTAISLPMLAGGKLIGVLNVACTRKRSFSLGQMKALNVLTGAAAAAIESTRLYAEVKSSEEKYRTIFENVSEGIFRISAGRFELANPALARILGYPSPAALQEAVTDIENQLFVEPDCWSAERRWLEEHTEGHQLECRLRRQDGGICWASLNTRAVRDDGVRVLYYEGTAEDITGRKRAEEELRRSEEQLRQAQKMEAVGRLAGGVAHDFNNLLTVITGYSELLLGGEYTEAHRNELLREVKKAGERAASLTRQLLALSRQQVIQPIILDLNSVVAETSRMLSRLIGEDIDVQTEYDSALGRIEADPGHLDQVLMNLAVNARDAMPNGGRLTISTRNVDLHRGYAEMRQEATPGPYVALTVTDTGCGMDEQTQARIFEPFFTTKEAGKGTGLGLATVYGIVKQSRGHVEVRSEPGRGTTFVIYFPRVEADVAVRLQGSLPPHQPKGTETILLAEDDPSVRQLSRLVLETSGYTVLEAEDAQEAIRLGERHPGPIDLLITDVIMPQMNGREVMNRLQELRPEIKTLYVSGYTGELAGRHGLLEEGQAFLQKPFVPYTLTTKVREVLDRN